MNNIVGHKNNLLFESNNFKDEDDKKNIGLIVKKYRLKRGLTRQILANKSGISLRYLAQLESGNGNPSISIITDIAYALNISLYQFFSNGENKVNFDLIDHRLNSFNPIQKSKVFDLINDIYKENKSNKNKNKIA